MKCGRSAFSGKQTAINSISSTLKDLRTPSCAQDHCSYTVVLQQGRAVKQHLVKPQPQPENNLTVVSKVEK